MKIRKLVDSDEEEETPTPSRKKRTFSDEEDDDETPVKKSRRSDKKSLSVGRRDSARRSRRSSPVMNGTLDDDEDGTPRPSRRSKKLSVDNEKRGSSKRSFTDDQFDSSNLYTLLDDINKHKHSWPFERPVSVREVPDYYEVVKNPMDFAKIKSKLNLGDYKTNADMMKDIELIFFNCDLYNITNSEIYQ